MGFRLLLLDNLETEETRAMVAAWPERLRAEIPGIEVRLAHGEGEAASVIGEVDAAYGKLSPELFAKAARLRWLQSPQAGPDPSFYHPALVDSDVVVTNMRGIFSDHISAHILAFLLTFARGLHVYLDRQRQRL